MMFVRTLEHESPPLHTVVFGWGDFPVALQQEEHPSSFESLSRTILACESASVCNMVSTSTTPITQRLNESENDALSFCSIDSNSDDDDEPRCDEWLSPSSVAVTTFGWSDFLLVGEKTTSSLLLLPTNSAESENCQFDLFSTKAAPHGSINLDSNVSFLFLEPKSTVASTLAVESTKTITFGTVQIREYNLQFGDHPWCAMYPLSLDWTYASEQTLSLDEHESVSRQQRERQTLSQREFLAAGQQRMRTFVRKCQPISVLERRRRLAQALSVPLSRIDDMDEIRRRRVTHERILQEIVAAAEDVRDETEDTTALSTAAAQTKAAGPGLLPRVATNYFIDPSNQHESPDPLSCGHVQGIYSLEYEYENEMDCSSFYTTNYSSRSRCRAATAWQRNLLEMNLHINGHVVHPGFEIQIYQ